MCIQKNIKKIGPGSVSDSSRVLKRGIRSCFTGRRRKSCIGLGYLSLFLGSLSAFSRNLQAQAEKPVSHLEVNQLKAEQRVGAKAIPVDTRHPRLSWEVAVKQDEGITDRTAEVTAFQVLVVTDPKFLAAKEGIGTNSNDAGPLVWNTHIKVSKDAFQVTYSGSPLKSGRTYYWSVRVWDKAGQSSSWSKIDSFQTALFNRTDWEGAHWIGARQMKASERILPGDTALKTQPFGTVNDRLPLFRRAFKLQHSSRKIKKATLFISGLGQFEASLNGDKIGDHFLDPGWTNYQKEALYVGLDVTRKLREGTNVLGVELGNGFYYIPNEKHRYKKLLVQYGYPKMICRLRIEYKDGAVQNIISDANWKTAPSSITFSSIYGGELENGRLRQQGWNSSGFDDQRWSKAIPVNDTPAALHLQTIDPIRVMGHFTPISVFKGRQQNKDGKPLNCWVYDLGQNCSGIPAIQVNGKKGDTVTLIPAELLTKDSAANQKATGSPYRLTYILAEDGPQSWQPKFTYYGLRYVQLEGAVPAGKPNPGHLPEVQKIQILHVRNSAPVAGTFECSDTLFNQTDELIRWGMKSNMMSVFTDCPHREKLGWLEQVHLMGNAVRYNWQIAHMLKKTIQDMRNAQTPEGLIPEIAPEFTVFNWGGDMFRDSPEWGSSSIILPWYLYQWYGDSSELRKSYSMMTRYNAYLQTKAKSNILYQGLGDWYDLGPNPPGVSQLTPMGITATAIHYYDLQILTQVAGLLNKSDDQQTFKKQAAAVWQAFNEKFLHHQKDSLGNWQTYYGTGSQTADAMAIYMQLVPDSLHGQVVDHLISGIKANNYGLTAGDIGYRYLLRVLEQEGYSDVIYRMNNRRDVPGYGYQLSHGATALTESWQALTSVSNNHFMLGHLMEWFYSGVLGIRMDPAVPGCKKMIIQPELVGDLTWARGSYETPYGQIRVDWQKKEKGLVFTLHLPVGVQASVRLPMGGSGVLEEYDKSTGGTRKINASKTEMMQRQHRVIFAAGAGDHTYSIVDN